MLISYTIFLISKDYNRGRSDIIRGAYRSETIISPVFCDNSY